MDTPGNIPEDERNLLSERADRAGRLAALGELREGCRLLLGEAERVRRLVHDDISWASELAQRYEAALAAYARNWLPQHPEPDPDLDDEPACVDR